MWKSATISIFVFIVSIASAFTYADNRAESGVVTVKSKHNVAETANRLENILKEKGMNVFARINHAEGAKKSGMEMRPTELMIFGNPKVGTPLMKCAPTVAIELPQKALIWEDDAGDVWLGYNNPVYLRLRHSIKGCDEVLDKITNALANFAKAATN